MSLSRRMTKRLATAAAAAAAAVVLSATAAGLAAPASAAGAAATAPSAVQSVRAPGFFAGGVWYIYQSNATVKVDLTQDAAGHLYGTVTSGNTVGTLRDGAVDGQNIYFTIGWSHGPVGRYTGVRGPDGRLSGTTFDLTNPSSQATWFTERSF
ncbi:hypothetical protein ABZ924_26700 [Streptomyces sp. NPDC046876]|uniref:hypothetical protein n=1 Tax=Streptomyces sp. NPDC046876 TaxID=3155616 RepID=UPI0033E9E407